MKGENKIQKSNNPQERGIKFSRLNHAEIIKNSLLTKSSIELPKAYSIHF